MLLLASTHSRGEGVHTHTHTHTYTHTCMRQTHTHVCERVSEGPYNSKICTEEVKQPVNTVDVLDGE